MDTTQDSLDRLRAEVAEVRASRLRLALGEDADRRAMERALHDGPQQHLIALAVNLQLAQDVVESDPVAARTLLDQMRRDVQVALDEAAKLAERIYPPLLESGGLAAALRAAAAAAGVRARIDVTGSAPQSPEIAGAVYFCWRELLEHARPGADASVDVQSTDGLLLFDASLHEADAAPASPDGALAGLGDRVAALGGRLDVRSEPGRGLLVSGAFEVSG